MIDIFEAVENLEFDKVEQYIKDGGDLDVYKNGDGDHIIMYCWSCSSNFDDVKKMLNLFVNVGNFNINKIDKNQGCPYFFPVLMRFPLEKHKFEFVFDKLRAKPRIRDFENRSIVDRFKDIASMFGDSDEIKRTFRYLETVYFLNNFK